ncbi:MAG: hypothetical protein AAB469_00510 [Patescibacteria group bacterium]
MPTTIYEYKTYNPYDVYLNSKGRDPTKNLPEKFQDFIFDATPADFIKDQISAPLILNENQSQELAKIVLELILADIYLGNIVQEIKNRLKITDDQKAKTIAGLIVNGLFAPILEELKKMHIEKFAKNLPKTPQQDDRIIDLKNNV